MVYLKAGPLNIDVFMQPTRCQSGIIVKAFVYQQNKTALSDYSQETCEISLTECNWNALANLCDPATANIVMSCDIKKVSRGKIEHCTNHFS